MVVECMSEPCHNQIFPYEKFISRTSIFRKDNLMSVAQFSGKKFARHDANRIPALFAELRTRCLFKVVPLSFTLSHSKHAPMVKNHCIKRIY